ncbi:MAG TPA: hypothetical protein VHC95_10665 [Opitutales bacterium]|nr:hypothetical protein [Opitutales bacterium]
MPATTPDAPVADAAVVRGAGWRKVLAIAEPLSVAMLFGYLLQQTWFRWSDPLIDFPKNLYIAWRVSAGDLLYRDVDNWYGPLANLIQGAGFKIFGVGMDTMMAMNIVTTVVILILLRAVFALLGNRLMVWLASVFFLLVFAFAQYGVYGNYNFIAPYVSQSEYSFLGLLLVLWALLKHLATDRRTWLGVAGAGLAVCYLDKPEAFFASVVATAVYFFTRGLALACSHAPEMDFNAPRRWLVSAAAWVLTGFAGLWLPVLIYFWVRGGLAFALYAANHDLVFMCGNASRVVANAHIMQVYMGFDQPWTNFFTELRQGAIFFLFCAGLVFAARRWTMAPAHSWGWWCWPALAMLAAVGCGWFSHRGDDIAPEFVFPVCMVALVCVSRVLWHARQGEVPIHALGLAVTGTAASLMMARMLLNARTLHYGFFMMPLAVLFWLHLLVVESARPGAGALRRNRLAPALAVVASLAFGFATWHTSAYYYGLKTYAVGAGRDRFYAFAPEAFTTGQNLSIMMDAARRLSPKDGTLAVFPEGIAVNYHLRRRSPLRELEFNPVSLRFAGIPNIVAELQSHPPDTVILFDRDFSEFGTDNFGLSEETGRGIIRWLGNRYRMVYNIGVSSATVTGHTIDLFLPANPAD